MSLKEIIFQIIEYKPKIPNISDFICQVICNETDFKENIYCDKNNYIVDRTNKKKSLKYIIKLMKNEKLVGVGNLVIGNDIFSKKIRRKIFNNINIFTTENNYKKIFLQNSCNNKIKVGINLTIEVVINYNIKSETQKERNSAQPKTGLGKRNLSFKKNDGSIKSSNNNFLTTSSSNINTYTNNLNNYYDCDNLEDNNLNCCSSDKLNNFSPSFIINVSPVHSPFSEPNVEDKKKNSIKKRIISSISFKNNCKNNKNLKVFSNNLNEDIPELKDKIKLSSSRNKKIFLCDKNKINLLMAQDSSSSKTSNSVTHTSLIDSTLLENGNFKIINNFDSISTKNKNKKNKENNKYNIDNEDIFIYNNINKYNRDTDDVENDLIKIENKKNRILKEMERQNKIFFEQEGGCVRLRGVVKNYGTKIENCKYIIEKLRDKNEKIKYKEEIVYNINKDLIEIITKVKESKEIENNIMNLMLKKEINKEKPINVIENNIKKYYKNIMIKIIKNALQNNYNVEQYLTKENNEKLKQICEKYNIFGSIIEENENEE